LTPDLGPPAASPPGHSRVFPARPGPARCPTFPGGGRFEIRTEIGGVPWKRAELAALVLYALGFYLIMIRKLLRLSHGTAAAAV